MKIYPQNLQVQEINRIFAAGFLKAIHYDSIRVTIRIPVTRQHNS